MKSLALKVFHPHRIDSLAPPLIRRLCEALDAGEVTYCHWKSNWRLDDWARGEGDLDLLVARSDAQQFVTILSDLGFKAALPSVEQQVPGIQNFYGFDPVSARFVHIHAHYQLVLGHDLTKNYHLPVEQPFLQSATRLGSFRVPAPEFELILFVLRMVLKFSLLESLARPSRASFSGAVQKELHYLELQSNPARVSALIERHLPIIDSAFFQTCKRSLHPDSSLWRHFVVGQQLRRQLSSHARSPRVVAALVTLKRRISKLGRHFGSMVGGGGGSSRRKHLDRGGALIALVGGDGAGKSTAVDALCVWLSKKFDTRRVHLGKPPRSPITWAVLIPLRLCQLFGNVLERRWPAYHRNEVHPGVFPGYLQLLRWVCAARDRYHLYSKARRFATNGGLVLCDRYPIPQIKLMDGPNISRVMDGAPNNRLVQLLLRAETRYYQRIMAPDLLLVLKLDPEVAVRRKVTESAMHVRTRARELWEVDWQDTQACVVDANQPLEQVLAHLQSIIWAEL
jgi:thymidylate kinase